MPKSKSIAAKTGETDFKNIVIKILIGSLLNIIFYFILTSFASLICLKADIDSGIYKYIIFVISAVCGIIGGYRAVRPIRKNGLIFGAVSALPAFLIIFLVSSIISHTGISLSGWIAAIIMTVFSAVGGILSVNRR